MSQLEDQQFYLHRAIDSAVKVIDEMREEKVQLHKARDEIKETLSKIDAMRNTIKQLSAASQEASVKAKSIVDRKAGEVDKELRLLNLQVDDARKTLKHIEAHELWKTAVREVFGPQGLQQVYDHMNGAREARDNGGV